MITLRASYMNHVNPQCLYRVKQIIGDLKNDPPLAPIVPVSKSTWWRGVREGRFPKPQKLSAKVTVWKGSDLMELVEDLDHVG